MTQALSALLAELEAATGPSRELDAKIARAVGWRERDGMFGREWISPAGRMAELPFFTESLDAAMTLARNQREAMVSHQSETTPHSVAMDWQSGVFEMKHEAMDEAYGLAGKRGCEKSNSMAHSQFREYPWA